MSFELFYVEFLALGSHYICTDCVEEEVKMRSKQEQIERSKGIGGSDAGRIMAGDWVELWEEKTGRREPEDLSDLLQVRIGIATENLNLTWFERRTGIEVLCAGCKGLVHREHKFMRGNLDGWVPGGIIEAKHTSAFAKDEEIVSRYYPQISYSVRSMVRHNGAGPPMGVCPGRQCRCPSSGNSGHQKSGHPSPL
jgi:predicted phage-related endonuclease